MHTEVSALGQLNVEVANVVGTDSELESFRLGLNQIYSAVEGFVAKEDGRSKEGTATRYTVRFVIPGPMVFQDECPELLHSIGLVGWRIEAQASPKGNPGFF